MSILQAITSWTVERPGNEASCAMHLLHICVLDTNSPQMLLVLLNCTVTRSKLASLLLKLMLLPIKHLMVMITFGV